MSIGGDDGNRPSALSTRRLRRRAEPRGGGARSGRADSGGTQANAQPHRLRRRCWALEGLTRIELASSVWKTEALPLSYSPTSGGRPPGCALSILWHDAAMPVPTGPSARLLGADQHVSTCAPARGVAQLGRAPALGAGGRRFKSCRPDITAPEPTSSAAAPPRAVDHKENEQAWSTAPSRSSPRLG